MASRAPLPGSPLTGSDLVTTVNARLATLFDASALPLASVGGTANVVTATLDPALTAGLVTGMRFGITWAATNTGAVTLNINGGGAVAVVSVAGLALPAGALESGLRSMLEYVAGSFVMLTPSLAESGVNKYFHSLTTTGAGTFTAPTDLPANTSVVVRMWGGGGGGHNGTFANHGGGGGGAFKELHLTLGDIGSSVSYNVAAGGAAGSDGGNTTFGAFGTAYGGRRGAGGTGGGGGGTSEAGLVASGLAFQGGSVGGTGEDNISCAGGDASGLWGGAGGSNGNSGTTSHRHGGRAVFGGGGGGANTSGLGGSSIFGGAGGNNGSAGAAKGGGGGRNAPGGRGQIDIFIG